MSWLELDDGILDHPKFIRAVNLGGSEAVHLWLGLRAYCGQLLTDGHIPSDMVAEVRGPKNAKRRADALAALVSVGLIETTTDGVLMHDFLQWSSSRDAVLAARERARERKVKSRGGHAVTTRAVTPVVTNPSSSPLPPPLPPPLRKSAERTRPSALPVGDLETGHEEREPGENKPDLVIDVVISDFDGPPDETSCPLDLKTQARDRGVLKHLAEGLRVEPEQVLASAHEFVTYWTIGAGMGQRRRHWMRKLREHVRKAAGRPGGLVAPGALDGQRLGDNADHDSRAALESARRVRGLLAEVDAARASGVAPPVVELTEAQREAARQRRRREAAEQAELAANAVKAAGGA